MAVEWATPLSMDETAPLLSAAIWWINTSPNRTRSFIVAVEREVLQGLGQNAFFYNRQSSRMRTMKICQQVNCDWSKVVAHTGSRDKKFPLVVLYLVLASLKDRHVFNFSRQHLHRVHSQWNRNQSGLPAYLRELGRFFSWTDEMKFTNSSKILRLHMETLYKKI